MTAQSPTPPTRMRYAIYARYSMEMQNELSIADQLACCRKAVVERQGVVVGEFHDDALSGWNLDRKGLTDLRSFAARGKCDAIIMWKFDRLMRDHDQTVVVKLLLRREYGVKLYCVEGFSEDDDNSPYTAMMEQMLAVFSAFYSKNLSIDTKRAKRSRAERGEFNGSEAPIGYRLVTKVAATDDQQEGLFVQPRLAAIVRRAFRMYATGHYSDADIAAWMNRQPEVRKIRSGRKPVDKEFTRWMLQNRIYTGRVSHSDTQYNGGLGQSRKSSRKRKEWFEGKHQAFVPDALFERCQEVRAGMMKLSHKPSTVRTYLLNDRVYCAHCAAIKPIGLSDDNYGKMLAYWHTSNERAYYRCTCKRRGYESCGQRQMYADELDAQVADILFTLTIPDGVRARVEEAVRARVEHETAFKRMEELHSIIQRVDFSWENGFIEKTEYFSKRTELQRELDALRPIEYDELTEAADLLTHFQTYWNECAKVEHPEEARKQLLAKIVNRVYVVNGNVFAVVLHGNFGVITGQNQKASVEITDALSKRLADEGILTFKRSHHGADGHRTRDLPRDRRIC